MSVGGMFGASKTKQTTKENSQVDPWAPTQPLLKDVLGQLQGMRGRTNLDGVNGAIDAMSGKLREVNTSAESADSVGADFVNTRDYVPDVEKGYGDFARRMTDTADGKNLDLGGNTYLQNLLKQVGDDAQNRVNATFAGAGRDLSGANNIEVGRGVTQAQLPMLLDQYRLEQGRTDAAGRDLFAGKTGTATTSSDLDGARAKMRAAGVGLQGQSREAGIADGERELELQQLKQKMPFDAMGWLTQLLYPAAGLGSQSTGDSLTKGSKIGGSASASAKLY